MAQSRGRTAFLTRDLIPTWLTRMCADNLSLFSTFLSLRLCLCLRRSGLHVRLKHKHKRMEIVPFSRACAYACVVRVNRDDASISTSASTRRLCLRRTGLHVGFLSLCLRRTCKPDLIIINSVFFIVSFFQVKVQL